MTFEEFLDDQFYRMFGSNVDFKSQYYYLIKLGYVFHYEAQFERDKGAKLAFLFASDTDYLVKQDGKVYERKKDEWVLVQ